MRYGRKNSLLRRWIVAFAFALIGAWIIIASGQLYLMKTTKETSSKLEAAKKTLSDQKMDETQAKLAEISNDTKLILQVLSREVLFSKLLNQLGTIVPSNTVLTSFTVDKLQGGLTLTVLSKDMASATQLQLNLQDPTNKIFEKADIENINCVKVDASTSDAEQANLDYPCTAQIRTLFTKDNPYLYITPKELSGLGEDKKQ